MAAANGLVDAAEATRNPCALSFALLAYGFAFRDADPDRAREALRRGLVIAQDSGNRATRPTWRPPWPDSKPNPATRWPPSNTSPWPSATTTTRETPPICVPTWLSSPLSRSARTLRTSGHHRRIRLQSPHRVAIPEIDTAIAHLRDVLGDQTYESLARKGETMTTAEMVTYAYDQIDQARAELNTVSK